MVEADDSRAGHVIAELVHRPEVDVHPTITCRLGLARNRSGESQGRAGMHRNAEPDRQSPDHRIRTGPIGQKAAVAVIVTVSPVS